MTIVEAIIKVLEESNEGLSSVEIYKKIIEKSLYEFGAKNPQGIVNSTIRKHTVEIEFSTASPIKYFRVFDKRKGKTTFILKDKIYKEKFNDSEPNKKSSIGSDILPEEELQISYNKHKQHIQEELLGKILEVNPVFFEHLVMELLIKMGYGGSDPKAGLVTPPTNDGGIDGVINEDKLGLDKIYIQAKRYSRDNKVDRTKLQQFVGAMENVQKGVFITTSDFSEGARKYVDKSQKSIMLINGEELTKLMVDYHVGIFEVATFSTYKIDFDYFSE